MEMAITTEEMYGRVYVDYKRKMFCHTVLPLSRPTYPEVTGKVEDLMKVKHNLIDQGWTLVSRKLFDKFGSIR